MKPSTKALLWEQMRVSGIIAAWLLLVGCLGLLVLNLSAGTDHGMFSQDLNQLSLVLNLMIGFMGAMLLMLRADGQGSLRFHFEPRHSRLPVETPILVFTIYSTRLLFIALLCGLLWILPRPVSTKEVSNLIPLVPVLSYAVLQGLVWSYRRVIWVGYVICSFCFVLSAVLIGIHLQDFITNAWSSSLRTLFESIPWESVLLWSFLPGIMLSFLLGWLGIHYTRLDMLCGPPRLSNLLERIGDWFRPEVHRFKSPLAAQFWFEWRRIGYLMPLISIAVLLFMILGLCTMLAFTPATAVSQNSMHDILGVTAQMLPYIAVVCAAVVAGAIAIRSKSRYPQIRPLSIRLRTFALLLAQWKALMFTLAGATLLSITGFILFDFSDVRLLLGYFLAGRVSVVELISIFLGPLLLAVALGWTMLFAMTRYWLVNILWIVFLYLLRSPAHALFIHVRKAQESFEQAENFSVLYYWIYNFTTQYPDIYYAFFRAIFEPLSVYIYFNIFILLVFMRIVRRKKLLHTKDIAVLSAIWLGIACYLSVFSKGATSWVQDLLLNLGLSTFVIVPFFVTPLLLYRRRQQKTIDDMNESKMMRHECSRPWFMGSSFAMVGLALCVVWSDKTPPKIHQAIREYGAPTNIEELMEKLPEVPESENAFPLYEQAILLLDALQKQEHAAVAMRRLPFFSGLERQGWPGSTFPIPGVHGSEWRLIDRRNSDFKRYNTNMKLYLNRYQGILDLLYEASERTHCRWPHESYVGYSSDHWDEISSNFLTIIQILTVERYMAALENDTERILKNIDVSIRLGNAFLDFPNRSSYSKHNYILQNIFYSLEVLFEIPELSLTDANLVQISQRLDNILLNHEDAWRQLNTYTYAAYESLLFDLYSYMYRYNNIKLNSYYIMLNDTLFERLSILINSIVGYKLFDRIATAHNMLLLLTVETDDIYMNARKNFSVDSRRVIPTYDLFSQKQFERIDYTRFMVAHVGIAVQRYYQQEGHYPESLEALVPKYLDSVPKNPLRTEEAMRYYVTERGAIVYALQISTDEIEASRNFTTWEEYLLLSFNINTFKLGYFKHQQYILRQRFADKSHYLIDEKSR